jgi:hypothetical protein
MATTDEHFGMRTTETLFENIDGGQAITEIESLCMNCEQNVVGIYVGYHQTPADENPTLQGNCDYGF